MPYIQRKETALQHGRAALLLCVAASSATNRVYVTLCRLRSLGLKDAIVYGEAGWTIPTSVRVVRARRSQGVA